MNRFIAALTFLTIIPLPKRIMTRVDFVDCEKFFPLIGIIVGLMLFAAYTVLNAVFPPFVAGGMTVGVMAKITGGLHLDGLSDTADGFLSYRDKERTIEIMKDSCIGSMGAIVQLFVILLKVAAVYELGKLAYAGVFLAPIVGRCAILIISSTTKHAKETGLGNLVNSSSKKHLLFYAISIPLVIAILLLSWHGAIVALIPLAVAYLIGKISIKKIGGFTGDVLGAGCEISEMACLVTLSAFAK